LVTVGGKYEATVAEDGSWALDLMLAPGRNSTTFTATHPETGFETKQTIRVYYAVPFDAYQSGYVSSFIATQAGVYGFGIIENPESPEAFLYNEGFDAASADVMERNAPSTEVTDSEWIAGYLRGNPTGWADGRGCTRPGLYPVPAGMGEIETDGWFSGYNAGFDSACNVGTTPPAWVGKSVCPYDPWKVSVIDQDVLCPPVRP
jgi:hypothetical protein